MIRDSVLTFRVQWCKLYELPFSETTDIFNAFNENKCASYGNNTLVEDADECRWLCESGLGEKDIFVPSRLSEPKIRTRFATCFWY